MVQLHYSFLTGSRGSVAVLSEWSGLAILVVLQMPRDVFFRLASTTRTRGSWNTLDGETRMGGKAL